MKHVVCQLLTGRDNETHDIGRWVAAAVFLYFLGAETINLLRGMAFDMREFGIGIGAVSAGVGFLLKLKENSEPQGGGK